MDTMTLQQYLDMYKQPLTEKSMDAISKLTEVAVDKTKKKKKKKHKEDSLKKKKHVMMEVAKIKKAKKIKKKKEAPKGALA
jgi:spore cortex formation protein SpoVR/YcgB (stage V sporulation)